MVWWGGWPGWPFQLVGNYLWMAGMKSTKQNKETQKKTVPINHGRLCENFDTSFAPFLFFFANSVRFLFFFSLCLCQTILATLIGTGYKFSVPYEMLQEVPFQLPLLFIFVSNLLNLEKISNVQACVSEKE